MSLTPFLQEFKERGFLHQITNEQGLNELMKEGSVRAYIGFDCTAISLHVGSLIQIMILRLLQKHGHTPVVLIGGGTTKIGDPSGKDEARKMLSDEDICNNMQGIKNVLSKFIKFGHSDNQAILVNNADWLEDIKYINFLRDYGKHFSINRMLTFDSVKLRLEREQNLSFLEFNYMLLQAYDFIELNKKLNCKLQIGGSDQWGNIINGVELSRRMGRAELFGLTTPLLTTANGQKMGKTANGAVWLSENLVSAYDYYQFWRNTDDQDVIKFLKLFTDLRLTEIDKLSKLEGQELNEAKKILAFEATRICHGKEKAKEAEKISHKIFEEKTISDNLPLLEMNKTIFEKGILIYQLFLDAGLTSSKGEAKRLINGNGARINDNTIADENYIVSLTDIKNGLIKLSFGKKKHLIVKAV